MVRCHFVATALLCVAAVAHLPAQNPPPVTPIDPRVQTLLIKYEERIASLEGEVKTLRSDVASRDAQAADSGRDVAIDQQVTNLMSSGVMGRLDQTTRYDNRFNPAFGVVGDFVAVAGSQRDGFSRQNRFANRGSELSILGRIDPYGYYALVIHATPESVEFEEGFAVVDQGLPSTFSLKAGKFYADFGRLLPTHDHELPFVDKPAVAQELLGGGVIGSGLEVHHYFGIGDTPVRWSFGVNNDYEADTLAVVGPAADGDAGGVIDGSDVGPFGRRSASTLVYHARATTVIELAETQQLQLGVSGLWVPRAVAFNDDPLNAGTTIRDTLEKHTLGLDATYRWADPGRPDALTVGTEFLFNSQRFITAAGPGNTAREHAWGLYAYGDYAIDKKWSTGLFFDYTQRARDNAIDWVGGGAYLTWNIDEFNRVRFQVELVDDRLLDDRYVIGMIQWTVIIGAHAHALDW